MHVYVINLARRPDRRAFMQQQADRLGLQFDYIDAVDARTDAPEFTEIEVQAGLHGRISRGDLACTLSHRKFWRLFLASGEPYAVVLEDDAILADDCAQFFTDTGWIPPGADVVKLERYGRHRPMFMDRDTRPAHSRRVGRFYGKSAGTAGYVVSAAGARMLLAATTSVDDPIDQMMFNPGRSALFGRLAPHVLEPAICEQEQVVVPSDIRGKRQSSRDGLQGIVNELRVVPRQLAHALSLALPLLQGRLERRVLTFRR
ncbi:MAG TPA: glycosyltransferase family 25 protein [Devosia sp.]|jgi:glycosyl transferase family 25|uniref:glycosyltransferase family 25 protein n=1 Tax=Devosia sp. TaxID=1871048 RepID=UPI002DDCB103|nr:glycosyltransferase family 25 protein [Devosia sp.]HEV2516944.1 glycosyltransferase family 25 protein [Devosia sp.]